MRGGYELEENAGRGRRTYLGAQVVGDEQHRRIEVVLVAESRPGSGSDARSLRGFWSHGRQGVTYRAGVWRRGLVVLDRAACFAVLMWRRGEGLDDAFADPPARSSSGLAPPLPDRGLGVYGAEPGAEGSSSSIQ